MARARHGVTCAGEDTGPQVWEAVAELDHVGQVGPDRVAGQAEHGRDVGDAELVDHRGPFPGQGLRGLEARLRVTRSRRRGGGRPSARPAAWTGPRRRGGRPARPAARPAPRRGVRQSVGAWRSWSSGSSQAGTTDIQSHRIPACIQGPGRLPEFQTRLTRRARSRGLGATWCDIDERFVGVLLQPPDRAVAPSVTVSRLRSSSQSPDACPPRTASPPRGAALRQVAPARRTHPWAAISSCGRHAARSVSLRLNRTPRRAVADQRPSGPSAT